MPTDPRSVVLTWDPPPPEDRNGPIVGYVINVTVIETGEMFQLTSSTNTLSVASLKPFTRYVCIIAARTPVGLGPFSTTITVMTPEDGKSSCVLLHLLQLHISLFCGGRVHNAVSAI